MKSLAKKTPVTPGSCIKALARGDRSAVSRSRASNVPSSITGRPGRNLRVAGLGVASVWMNIALGSYILDRLADASAQETALERHDRAVIGPPSRANARAHGPRIPCLQAPDKRQ